MKVVKGLRKLLHPSKIVVWINCGLDSWAWIGLKEGSPKMGASPQTPWLHGAGAPLRSPPGGAFIQTVWMGDESFVELAPVE